MAASIRARRGWSARWRWPTSRTSSSRRRMGSCWFRCRRGPVTWGSFSRGGRRRRRWSWRCGGRTRNCGSRLRPRWRRLSLRSRRDEVGRQLCALAEEVLVHLLEKEFLRLGCAEVEPVLIYDHLHVLDPHLPRFLGDVVEDFLRHRMALERDFVHALHFFLELHAEDLARAWPYSVVDLVETASTASTSHVNQDSPFNAEAQRTQRKRREDIRDQIGRASCRARG